MSNVTLIVLCAGNSSRFALKAKKQWLRTADLPLWLFVTNRLKEFSSFNKIIIASHKKEITQQFYNTFLWATNIPKNILDTINICNW